MPSDAYNNLSPIAGKFSDPVFTPSSSWFPRTLSEGFELCQWLYANVPLFRQVNRRLFSFFITDIEFIDCDEASQKNLKDFLYNILDLKQTLQTVGDDWGCYGNAFVRLYMPFKRTLLDPRPNYSKEYYDFNIFASRMDQVKFNLEDLTFTVPDPQNDFNGYITCQFKDTPNRRKENYRLMIVDPRYIRIIYSRINGECTYIWKFSQDIIDQVKRNVLDVINTIPRSMLQALKNNQDFKFKKGELFHFKAPSVSGLSRDGWGISEFLLNFRNIYKMLLYSKADEMLALDYVTPLRVVSMDHSGLSGGNDSPAQSLDSVMFVNQVSKMVSNYRRDPTSWQVSPYPLSYQEMGGTGKQYISKDISDANRNELLHGAGFPPALFDLSLNLQILPVSLRLLQTDFWYIYNQFNKFTKWVVSKTQRIFTEKKIEVIWQQPRIVDDVEAQATKMNLGINGLLPYKTFLESLGISDPINAVLQRKKEDAEIQNKLQKVEEDIEKERAAAQNLEAELQDGLSAPAGAMQGASILTKEQEAMSIAQQLLAMPVGQSRQQLQALEGRDFPLYSLVMAYMDKERANLRSQGYQAMKEQNGYN